MRACILLMCSMFLLCACSSISVHKDDMEVRYSRLGGQNISGLRISRDMNGTVGVELNKQEASLKELLEFLRGLTK